MTRPIDHIYIAATILFTVYGQLILKWRIARYGDLPEGSSEKFVFLLRLLIDPYIFSGFVAAFVASLAWMATMTKMDLSYAYPFMALNFVLVVGLAAWLFSEPLSVWKVGGVLLIVGGVIMIARN